MGHGLTVRGYYKFVESGRKLKSQFKNEIVQIHYFKSCSILNDQLVIDDHTQYQMYVPIDTDFTIFDKDSIYGILQVSHAASMEDFNGSINLSAQIVPDVYTLEEFKVVWRKQNNIKAKRSPELQRMIDDVKRLDKEALDKRFGRNKKENPMYAVMIQIQNTWITNFKTSEFFDVNTRDFKYEFARELFSGVTKKQWISRESILKHFTKASKDATIDQLKKYLNVIGIDISLEVISSHLSRHPEKYDKFLQICSYLFYTISNFELVKNKKDPFYNNMGDLHNLSRIVYEETLNPLKKELTTLEIITQGLTFEQKLKLKPINLEPGQYCIFQDTNEIKYVNTKHIKKIEWRYSFNKSGKGNFQLEEMVTNLLCTKVECKSFSKHDVYYSISKTNWLIVNSEAVKAIIPNLEEHCSGGVYVSDEEDEEKCEKGEKEAIRILKRLLAPENLEPGDYLLFTYKRYEHFDDDEYILEPSEYFTAACVNAKYIKERITTDYSRSTFQFRVSIPERLEFNSSYIREGDYYFSTDSIIAITIK